MGTTGYLHAATLAYRRDDVILEVGSGNSTSYLANVGPLVVTVDVDPPVHHWVATMANVEAHCGRAEDVLDGWSRPIGFAWLDGHDWPYRGNSSNYYAEQRNRYEDRGYEYSHEASRRSHLAVARLISDHARVIAFDDTWQTHAYRPGDGDRCSETVPPATTPAPMLAMDRPIDDTVCHLHWGHPHHDNPSHGWNGKGGTAIPYLLDHGFRVVRSELCLVVLEKVKER